MAAATCPGDPRMDLVVRTLYRTIVLNNVDGTTDVTDLKNSLHQRGLEEQIPIPVASKQRLVHKGAVLTSGSLQQAGVRSGDHLVLLLHRANASTSITPVDTTPVPTEASVRSAIIAEARRRGVENTIVDEPARASRPYGMPTEAMAMEVDNQLLQLIQALGGRAGAMGAGAMGAGAMGGRAGQHLQGGGAADGAAAAGQQQQAEAGAAAGGARRYVQPPMPFTGVPQPGRPQGAAPPGAMLFGMRPPGMPVGPMPPQPGTMLFGMPQLAQPGGGPAPTPPAAIPEPDAQAVAQLGEMGFGEPVVRKALLLHRNDMEAALNWLLQHGDDPAAADPLTDEQLRQIYSRGPRGPPSEPELVEQLVAMGFGRNQSAAALRRFRNMDMALAYLLRTAEDAAEQEAGGEGGGGAGAQGMENARNPEPEQAAGGGHGSAAPAVALGQQQGRGQQAVGPGDDATPPRRRGEGSRRRLAAGPRGGGAGSEDGDSAGLPTLASTEDEDAMHGGVRGGPGGYGDAAMGEGRRGADRSDDDEDGGGGQQQQRRDAPLHPHAMGMPGEHEDDNEDDDEGDDEDDDGEEEDDDDFAGAGRGGALRMQLGGGALGLGAAAGQDDGMGPLRGFGGPFSLYGGAAHGVGAASSAMAVTRGPDGNELVLGAAGATMPPLMPAHGVLMGHPGGMGGAVGLGGGGAGGLGAHMVDLPGLLQGGDGGDDELVMQGMGLVQQLLNAVLRDALNGGEGGGAAAGNRR